MAIFKKSNELKKQKRFRTFQKQTGWKAGVMKAAGYNPDGTKNTWGKFMPPGFQASGGVVADIASGGSDAKEVLKDNRSNLLAQQMAAGKLAMNFVPGGAGAKMIGGMALEKGQSAAEGGGLDFSSDDAMSTVSATEGLVNAPGSGSDAVAGMNNEAAKLSAMDEIESGASSSNINETISDVSDIDNYTTEADYLAANGGDVAGAGKKTKFGSGMSKFKGGKFMQNMNKAAGVASIAGDAVNFAQATNAYNKGLKNKKKSMMMQTLDDAYQNYL